MKDLSIIPELIEEVYCCPYCHSSSKGIVLTKNLLRIVTCLKCGLKYTDRRWNKEGILLYYQEGYYTGQVPGSHKNYEAEKDEKLIDFAHKFQFLKQFCVGRRLLDVGCATGFSLVAARELGFTPEGIEFSEWAVQHNTTGLKIFQKDLLELEEQHLYNAISMWDVIEHLPYPEKAFRKMHKLLQNNGILIFTYPDPSSRVARILGSKWGIYIPEEHYFFYPPTLLKNWLARCGFKKLTECYEKRYCSLGKLSQKILPFLEKYLYSIHMHHIMVSFLIPYKRMAVFRRID